VTGENTVVGFAQLDYNVTAHVQKTIFVYGGTEESIFSCRRSERQRVQFSAGSWFLLLSGS
jgi:hypothetical protein